MPLETATRPAPHGRHGSNAGQPLTRRDGVLKVTGRATYAADNHPENMLYAVAAVSSIARGRVVGLDLEAAKAHPGVVEVLTPANRPPLAHDPDEKIPPFGFRVEALQDDRVRYVGQPIALVVAETLEAATEGAALLTPQYEVDSARTELQSGEHFSPPTVGVGSPARTAHGDIEAGLVAAARNPRGQSSGGLSDSCAMTGLSRRQRHQVSETSPTTAKEEMMAQQIMPASQEIERKGPGMLSQ